jgi:hypothetical protein
VNGSLNASELTLTAGHAIADSFWRQAALNSVAPIVAALLGGIVVNFVVRLAQRRRERQQLRSSLSLDMMRTAYGFYRPLIEDIRTISYSVSLSRPNRRVRVFQHPNPLQDIDLSDLSQRYEEFRIAARVIEEQLRVNFREADARWLWHGVVDMLSARYYRLAHSPERFYDMTKTHCDHREDPEIPPNVQPLFMTQEDCRNDQTVDSELLYRFEIFINEAIRVVLKHKINPPSGAAFIRPGRGSLGSSEAPTTFG